MVEKVSSVWVVWGRLFGLVGRCEPGSEAMVELVALLINRA